MTRVVRIAESTQTPIDLTRAEANSLLDLGRSLAKQHNDSREKASLVQLRWTAAGFEVTVPNAIGILSIPTLEIVVQPKVPLSHLTWIAARSNLLPRLSNSSGTVSTGEEFWEIAASWMLNATERLLRDGLLLGYRSAVVNISIVRGRLDAIGTSRAFARGRPDIVTTIDEFDTDTAENRLIREACKMIARSGASSTSLKSRARRLLRRLDGIGDLQPGDRRNAIVDSHTAKYSEAIRMAHLMIGRKALGLDVGAAVGWSFLVKTPDLVESGLRTILNGTLDGGVSKSPLKLPSTSMSINPDLCFANGTIGDVKYKVMDSWNRADLYEVVAFASGYSTPTAILVSFGDAAIAAALDDVPVGTVTVHSAVWRVDLDPASAEARFVQRVRDLLSNNVALSKQ